MNTQFSKQVTNVVERFSGTDKAYKMLPRLDIWIKSVTDEAQKQTIIEARENLTDAIESLKTFVTQMDSLPVGFDKRVSRAAAALTVGMVVKIAPKHVHRYDGILETTNGLVVKQLRAAMVALETPDGACIVASAHVVPDSDEEEDEAGEDEDAATEDSAE